jgi:hypothetical protein
MKTTIEIADALLADAKRVARKEGSTVRALVEEGLRRALDDRKSKQRPFKLRLVTVKGKGLRPGVDPTLPRELAYDLPPIEVPTVHEP